MIIKSPVGMPGERLETSFLRKSERAKETLRMPISLPENMRIGKKPLLHFFRLDKRAKRKP